MASRVNIIKAVKNVSNIQDAELCQSSYCNGPLGPLCYGGGFGLCFPLTTSSNKKYAFKVWFTDISDIQDRLVKISKYLETVNLPYFVGYSFLKNGLNIPSPNPEIIPALKMEWIDGLSLKQYVCEVMTSPASESEKKAKILSLVEKFKKCFKQLHDNHISHGDLQHENILIVKDTVDSVSIRFVDYDSVYVPTLGQCDQNTKGYSGYQHPDRTNSDNEQLPSTEKDDYFSEKIIILSLLIFAYYPDVYKEIDITKNEQEFLFASGDFNDMSNSRVYCFIKKQNTLPAEIKDLFDEICKDLQKPLEDIESLRYPNVGKYVRHSEDTNLVDPDWLDRFKQEHKREVSGKNTYPKKDIQGSSKTYTPNPDKYNRS